MTFNFDFKTKCHSQGDITELTNWIEVTCELRNCFNLILYRMIDDY